MKKFIVLSVVFSANVFAIALGDVITPKTIKAQTTTTSSMQLSATPANHTEYTIATASSKTTVLVNKQNQVYGLKWIDKSSYLQPKLGNYKAEFEAAYVNRPNKHNNRVLNIDSSNLSVHQFGLPGGPFQGDMYAKDLAPQ